VPAPRRERLAWRGLVPPDALSALLVEQDVGLALEPSSPANKDLTISNKILQYLNAGLAVVATPTAGQREVLARVPGAGLLLPADTGAAAEALDALLRDRAALERRQRAARRGAEEYYCWEREAPRLLALVASALQAAPARC
jgi:glycosyltransferase involved in cell wall biosynthesis